MTAEAIVTTGCSVANVVERTMADTMEISEERPLFGGAITCNLPLRFDDVSDIREVPNNQEAFVDANRDESIIVELLELKDTVEDQGSARWFLQDLAVEEDSQLSLVVEAETTIAATDIPNLDAATTVNGVVGTLALAKSRQGPEARNLVRVYLSNIRLKGVDTDVLVTVYEPLIISENSESAAAVGAGATVPAAVAGCMPAADVFKLVLSTFRIKDWALFGYTDEEVVSQTPQGAFTSATLNGLELVSVT